jgi:uncharacterized circularly permuted ATP-grasp superfamily protein/uncharacterized alpha-E superfamily protein
MGVSDMGSSTSPPPPLRSETFRRGYARPDGTYDETLDDAGALRPHWQMFVSSMDDLGQSEIRRRWEQAQRLIHENGVTYNVYGDPQGMDRPWSLDALPVLLSPGQFEEVEAGLTQRTTLLELVLADLYGPQKLMAEGLIPPELLYAHPNFLRACHGMEQPQNRWLHMYAADVGRGAGGALHVVADRTQAPSGAGYALENRIVISRMLPEVFRDCNVQRLALYFRSLRETLTNLSRRNKENPRIVLLTPGPYNETYFEHAYLARYLGFTLVEGADLTVRDQRVYLKTLGGLQQVDVILRRLDDDYCDSLELRADSFLGVPGLVEAARQGNVAIANPLGSGTLETPALMPLLPKLCRTLLGDDLKLPSAPTWWCGDAASLDHVVQNMHRLVIKPTFPSAGGRSILGSELSVAEREDLARRIAAEPIQFTAQEQLPLSTSPVLTDTGVEPRHTTTRFFAAATGATFTVMPGGLSRFAGAVGRLVVSMQQGGGSKDTWVVSGRPVSHFSLLQPATQPVALSRGGGDLPSRVADNLFWLGRYVERAEGLVRLGRGIVVRLADQATPDALQELPILLRAFAAHSVGPGDDPVDLDDSLEPDAQVLRLLFTPGPGVSLHSTISDVHRIGRVVRDQISLDTWRILSSLEQIFRAGGPDPAQHPLGEIVHLLNRMIVVLSAFAGLVADSMTRGQAWRFLDMGRRLERILNGVKLLRHTVGASRPRPALLEAVLEIADSAMTYRRRYLTSLQLAPVVDLLLADESNPRSAVSQLVTLADHVERLPRDSSSPRRGPEQLVVMRCLNDLRLMDVEAASAGAELPAILQKLFTDMPLLSDSLSQSYLAHATVSRQLASTEHLR